MAQRAESAADSTRLAVGVARAMTVGLRSWGFYPPEHPAVSMAVERLMAAAAEAAVALAITLNIFGLLRSINVDEASKLKE